MVGLDAMILLCLQKDHQKFSRGSCILLRTIDSVVSFERKHAMELAVGNAVALSLYI